MPKTDVEWGVLDHRIAQEIMDLLTWDDLTPAEQQSYIDVVPKQFLDMSMEEWKRSYWKREYGHVFTVDDYSGWQPHKNVARALTVKDQIVRQEWCFDLSNRPGTLSVAYFWQMLRPSIGIQGKADTDAKAICLATEQWLDAQKETQDDPG